MDAIRAGLDSCRTAPLPAEPLRDRALAWIAALRAAGATVHAGAVPDDARHRMGWVLPPALVMAGPVRDEPGLAAPGRAEPIGPVLTVLTWRSPREIAGAFTQPRHADGIACAWGLDDAELGDAGLPHTVVLRAATPLAALADGTLPMAWTAGKEIR